MKKLIVFLPALLTVQMAIAQVHLSHFFELKNEFAVDSLDVFQPHWVGAMWKDWCFFTTNQVPASRHAEAKMDLWRVNLVTGECHKLTVALPIKKHASLWELKYWVYDLYVDSVRLLVTTQKQIFEYVNSNCNSFAYSRTLETQDADFSFSADGVVYGISQINDYGFRFYKWHKLSVERDSVADFPLTVPFLLQYGPNGYLKQFSDRLYCVDSPIEPAFGIYDFQGRLLKKVRVPLTSWQSMPADYVREIQSKPYGTDRAMFIFNSCGAYSFPMELFPLNERAFLLAVHQLDTLHLTAGIEVVVVQLDSAGAVTQAIPTRTTFLPEQVISAEEFPIYYASKNLCLTLCGENRLVQLVRESDEAYNGKTGKQYFEENERYFELNDPKMKMRVMDLKNFR